MAHAKLRHSSVTSAGATLQKYIKAITLQTPVDKNADKLKRKGDLRLLETGAAADETEFATIAPIMVQDNPKLSEAKEAEKNAWSLA